MTMDGMFDDELRAAVSSTEQAGCGEVFTGTLIRFGGETPGHALEGLAAWSADNVAAGEPFHIRDISLRESEGNIPAFQVWITVDYVGVA